VSTPPKQLRQSLVKFDTVSASTKGGITRFGRFSLHTGCILHTAYPCYSSVYDHLNFTYIISAVWSTGRKCLCSDNVLLTYCRSRLDVVITIFFVCVQWFFKTPWGVFTPHTLMGTPKTQTVTDTPLGLSCRQGSDFKANMHQKTVGLSCVKPWLMLPY